MDTKAVETNLKIIKAAVDNILKHLPDEQQHVGSECQRIDSAANALYHKYVDTQEQPHTDREAAQDRRDNARLGDAL